MNKDDKLDKIAVDVAEINVTLKFQSRQLEEHIHRTALLEERITPIEDHTKFVQGLLKVGIYVASVGSFVVGLLKLLRKL
jgi:hypothetical protein